MSFVREDGTLVVELSLPLTSTLADAKVGVGCAANLHALWAEQRVGGVCQRVSAASPALRCRNSAPVALAGMHLLYPLSHYDGFKSALVGGDGTVGRECVEGRAGRARLCCAVSVQASVPLGVWRVPTQPPPPPSRDGAQLTRACFCA